MERITFTQIVSIAFALAVVILPTSAYATHESCGNRDGGGGCQNCSCGGGNCQTVTNTNPPPAGKCDLDVVPSTVEKGASEITISWSPDASKNGGTLRRTGPGEDDSYSITTATSKITDMVAGLAVGRYVYSASYIAPKQVWVSTWCDPLMNKGCGGTSSGYWTTKEVKYACTAPLTITKPELPECSDNKDNDDPEDTYADERDPGCHTDGDPDNPGTYDPEDPDEQNAKPNLRSTISAPAKLVEGKVVSVPVTIRNTTDIGVPRRSSRDVTFKKIGSGNTVTLWHGRGSYAPNELWERSVNFRAPAAGEYEMCIVADSESEIVETNEGDNNDCVTVTVEDDPTDTTDDVSVRLDIRAVGSGTDWYPGSVRVEAGHDVELRVTPKNADSCAVVGGGFSIDTPTNRAQVTTDVTEPDSGSRTYTIECQGEGGPVTNTARVFIDDATGDGTRTDPTLIADPNVVRKGGTSVLEWDTGNHTGCVITGNGENPFSVPDQPTSGVRSTEPINAETTFTLTCSGADPATATVRVLPSIIEF